MNENRPDERREAARKVREERLAAALRANLRRRKASRETAESGGGSVADGAGPEGEEPR